MKALLDYYSSLNDESASEYTFAGLKEYWRQAKRKKTGLFYQWSMKDQALLSRLMKEYNSEEIVEMLDLFLIQNPKSTFGHFFVEREALYTQTHKPSDYGYD